MLYINKIALLGSIFSFLISIQACQTFGNKGYFIESHTHKAAIISYTVNKQFTVSHSDLKQICNDALKNNQNYKVAILSKTPIISHQNTHNPLANTQSENIRFSCIPL